MTIKFRQFQNNHSYLTSCLTTSRTPIADLIVAFFAHSNIAEVTKEQRPTLNRIFLLIQKLSWGLFLPPSAIGGLKDDRTCSSTPL